jgi:hypothetical protein
MKFIQTNEYFIFANTKAGKMRQQYMRDETVWNKD